VIYDPIAPVHVSGHASQEEMKLLLQLVKPEYFIPIHGELRHLHQHAAIAREIGIPSERIAVVENGQVIEFSDGKLELGERVPGGYIFVDGSGVGDVDYSVMREREMLARDGVVLVNLTLDRQTGRLREQPEIITRGFIYEQEAKALIAAASKHVAESVRYQNGNLQKDLEQSVKMFLYNETKRRPYVFVTLTRA
jgi:ribonuclease J